MLSGWGEKLKHYLMLSKRFSVMVVSQWYKVDMRVMM